MSMWTIIPRDPLIFRDGKPFMADAGARAKSLPFPFPSTLAGAARSLAGRDSETGIFDKSRIEELLAKKLRGPLLIEFDGEKTEYLFPAPADALLLKKEDQEDVNPEEEKARLIQLKPSKLKESEETDLEDFLLITPTETAKAKPHRKAPRYWNTKTFFDWLKTPQNDDPVLAKMGHNGPIAESRMHVQIEASTGTALDGALFQTSGLEFTELKKDEKDIYPALSQAKELGLAIETDVDLRDELGFLGGERRVAQWQESKLELPECPSEVKSSILAQLSCRLILLTPAYFENSHLPAWFTEQYGVEIIAAAVPRYQVVSGWDYKSNENKPTRRLAPAGSVYFLKINKDVKNFAESVWMQNISDGEQNRADGFGLAVLGTWSNNGGAA
jgi:CRISPR-associated protein Cmr3